MLPFTEIANSINSSSSNSNSPVSLSKISTSTSASTSGSVSGSSSRKNRKVLPVKDREYDPEKHCGVRIGNMKPCTRSLTCKTHQISLRRNVEGRSKPFDQLLADHRNNAKDTHKHSSSKVHFYTYAYIVVLVWQFHWLNFWFKYSDIFDGRQWKPAIIGIGWW